MNPHHPPRPSAYLWARCEGWMKVGTYHAVIVDDERGEVTNEKGIILLRREADGLWIEPDKEVAGMSYDRLAVTHLPIDPWAMSKEGWEERFAAREAELEAKRNRLKEKAAKERQKRRRTSGNSEDASDSSSDHFKMRPDHEQ